VEEDEMTRWYVVHTQPRAEARASWRLENQGFRCFLPRINTIKKHSRGVISALAPLFSRYSFVRFDLNVAQSRAINGIHGVVRLLTNGIRPLVVPLGVVEALLLKCNPPGVVPLESMSVFTKSRKVRIRSGAFSGQTAEVNEIYAERRDRVHVLLTLLGAEAKLQLASYAIEAA
jgi:transcriptional antiterminator RfaH